MAFWYKGQRVDGGGDSVPKGAVILWSGTAANIPDGWALCDGQDGRPDLRDKFVLGGGGTHPVGETGGAETVALTVAEMPSHSHGVHQKVGGLSSPIGGWLIESNEAQAYQTIRSVQGCISNSGGNQPHNNMPPYYTLCYIIKV